MQIDWNLLRRDFEKQRCILMLGPKMSSIEKEDGTMPILEQLSIYISTILDEYGIEYDDQESSKRNLSYMAQRFLNIDKTRRVDLEDLVEEFYQQQSKTPIPEAYRAIAALPTKIIINVNPDDFMVRALKEIDKEPIVRQYNFQITGESKRNRTVEPIDIDLISERTPLVYNLLGSLDEKESLVLTEADQMEFIRNIVKGDPPIPDEVLSYFDRRKTYIFIGFNMESWHFRLLLDTFNLKFHYFDKDHQPITPQTDNYPIRSLTKVFYEEHFNFLFLEHKINDFIQEMNKQVVAPSEDQVHKIYISFADNEEDRSYLEALEKQLKPLEQNGSVHIWHKNRGAFGDEINAKEHLQQADTILLLMSSDFLSDDALLEEDLEWAIVERQERHVNLIPVLARHCTWRAIRELRGLQALPKNEEPISDDSWTNIDEACYEIVQELKTQIQL